MWPGHMGTHVPFKQARLASFPDSTPQLFIALSLPSFLSHSAIKSWGVESGNEAKLVAVSLSPGSEVVLPGFVEYTYKHILPACFLAPLRATFDLNDGYAFLVSEALSLHVAVTTEWNAFHHFPYSRHLEKLLVF